MEFKGYHEHLRRGAEVGGPRTRSEKLPQTCPDRSPRHQQGCRGGGQVFKEVSEANEVLSDAEKSSAVTTNSASNGSRVRSSGRHPIGTQVSSSPARTSQRAGGEFSDFFETLFSRMRRGERPPSGRAEFHARGEDHHAKILIDLRDSLEGTTRTLSLRMPAIDADGHVVIRGPHAQRHHSQGCAEGQSVRLKGQGAPGIGRLPAGDLYGGPNFNPHPLYRVVGSDLSCRTPGCPVGSSARCHRQVPDAGGADHAQDPGRLVAGA